MNTEHDIAIWALTPSGINIARQLTKKLKKTSLFYSKSIDDNTGAITFEKLSQAVSEYFQRFKGHIFIMSTGIVVRVIANHIKHKAKDPAVVVVDDSARFAISLISGHIGGANELAFSISNILSCTPVITTATDVNNLPAIDMIAKQQSLIIENHDMIKQINMAFIKNKRSCCMIHITC
ncbi:MAG: hypothetical protein OMM_04060 [Candidatus Magnetoglobus multicellularis str. Araruama]|uniref:Cobalamin synthesis G N-terminal domain-containing protein n=1 Tax=Candidatus Magnetoglobus multicellularis str. Araruama TaxID=890399 RepID=A0A1V1P344_9BACT|nr:MAG: hypothetical protein OMM_04060 [Candidatus Magnetoglobus multicellularis str. Araruama]